MYAGLSDPLLGRIRRLRINKGEFEKCLTCPSSDSKVSGLNPKMGGPMVISYDSLSLPQPGSKYCPGCTLGWSGCTLGWSGCCPSRSGCTPSDRGYYEGHSPGWGSPRHKTSRISGWGGILGYNFLLGCTPFLSNSKKPFGVHPTHVKS